MEPKFSARGSILARCAVLLVWSLSLIAAGITAYNHRHDVNPDGVSYLDLSDRWSTGPVREVVNGHWSPAYPGLLALARSVAFGREHELEVLHALNVVFFAAALGALHFLLRVCLSRRGKGQLEGHSGWVAIPAEYYVPIGLIIGATVLLGTTSPALTSPDMMLAGLVVLALAWAMRICSRPEKLGNYVGLGATLGVSYLTKSFMFPMSLVIMLLVVIAAGLSAPVLRRILLCGAVFAVLAGPQVGLLSASRGRLTFSDSTWLSVLWLQKGVPYVHWRGGPDSAGAPENPPRVVCRDPQVLEFASPVHGTYPLWLDPSYWHEGGNGRPEVPRMGRRMLLSAWNLLEVLSPFLGVLICLFALRSVGAYYASGVDRSGRSWILGAVLPCGALLYAPFHIEPRFMGGFLAVFSVWLLDGARVPWGTGSNRPPLSLIACVVAAAVLPLLHGTATEVVRLRSPGKVGEHVAIQRLLRQEGLAERGDAVAVVGTGLHAYWARYSGLRIVADILPREPLATLWAQDPVRLESVRSALLPFGVRCVFARLQAPGEPPTPWRRIADTEVAVLTLE